MIISNVYCAMSTTKTVMICDDDKGILDVTRIVLEDKGYVVILDSDGAGLYLKAKEVKPDLILLDLWMPKMGGEEIAQSLKNDSETKGIPLIIISASKDVEKVSKRIQAEAFLAKPFNIDTLEDMVDRYIG